MTTDAKAIWDKLLPRQQHLIMVLGDPHLSENFAASTYSSLAKLKLITDTFPETLTELGLEVREYGTTINKDSH